MGLPVVNVPNDIASRRVVSLSSLTQGKGRLYRVEKFDAKSDAKTEAVNEVGNQDAAGFRDKPGAYTITIELHEQQGLSWPDWDALKDGKEQVVITDQIVGGRRWEYSPCRISSVDRSGQEDGTNSLTVELIALQRKSL